MPGLVEKVRGKRRFSGIDGEVGTGQVTDGDVKGANGMRHRGKYVLRRWGRSMNGQQ
jgi:hypothetical protein